MLSKKLTFSLASLVMMIAFGLAFIVPSATAAEWWEYAPEVVISVTDESSAPGNQVEAYKEGKIEKKDGVTSLTVDDAKNFEFYIKVTKGKASLDPSSTVETGLEADKLHISDLSFTLYDKDGVEITGASKASAPGLLGENSKIEHVHVRSPDGKNFKVTIGENDFKGAAAMLVHLPAGEFRNIEPDAVAAANADVKARRPGLNKKSPEHNLSIILVPAEPAANKDPEVVSIVRLVDTASVATSRFQSAAVSGPFQVRITLTEEGKDFAKDGKSAFIDVLNGKVTQVVPGVPFFGDEGAKVPAPVEGNYEKFAVVPEVSGRDQRYHPYSVTIEPDLKNSDDVEIRVKKFDDLVIPPNSFVPPSNYALAIDRSLLTVKVNPAAVTDIFAPAAKDKPSNEIFISDGLVIPAGGYLVLTRGKAAQSGVVGSPAKIVDKKLAAQEKYNVKNEFAFPAPGSDLDAFFRFGSTIRLSHQDVAENKPAADAKLDENDYLVSNEAYTAGSVVISEIMWGRDVSLGDADAPKSQWIELHNTTDKDISIDKNEWTLAFYQGSGGPAGAGLIDEISNASPYWRPPGKSGATQDSRRVDVINKTEVVGATVEKFLPMALQSMYRKIDGTNVMSGTSADSWAESTAAGSLNLDGLRAGTPGAATPYTPPAADPDPEPIPEPTAPVATAADLRITEIMVASNEGRLPQWVEITNVSTREVSLTDWVLGIANDDDDAEVVGPSFVIKLDGVTLDAGHSALVVSKLTNRNSGVAARSKADDNAGDLDSNRIVDAKSQVKPPDATYSLLSEMAFRLSLQPPLPLAGGGTDRGDVVGNLGGGWELPMSEDDRSSLIRREMDGEIKGTDEAGWVLASETNLNRASGAYVATYYGDKDDAGTPGYKAGGELPVELSMFTAARDRLTGEVKITWETQSELNNAGFYLKRSQQKTGQFTVINATMIAGAGTTSEKQAYTYTDTTAKPNIVYYYQIEDVSLDGNRQTLTRAHRLKGHIGAAGKLTTLWGELKNDQ